MLHSEFRSSYTPMPVSEEQIEETGLRAEKRMGKRFGQVITADMPARGFLYTIAEKMSSGQREWFMRTMDRRRALEAQGREDEAHVLLDALWEGLMGRREFPEYSGNMGGGEEPGNTGGI